MEDTNINLIFEAAVVKRLKRTGWQILGDNEETIGEHSFMTAVIAYILAKKISVTQKINLEKILLMSIFHDFHEARTGDVDKIATFYITRDTKKANYDIFENVDKDLHQTIDEYEEKQSIEARIVYEANILALLVELKQIVERGNANAVEWLTENVKRVRLKESKDLAKSIVSTNSQNWWRHIRAELSIQFSK